MKISVVTISYNQAQFLPECIDSVLSQDHRDFEHIIVDAGSSDGSRNIIDAYGDRVTKLFEEDEGPADGLNKGFQLATGAIFGFLNADDLLLPKALSTIDRYFSANPRVAIVSGCGYRIDSQGQLNRKIVPSKLTRRRLGYGAVSVFQQGTFFRASAFRLVGGFNTVNHACWDGELYLDMLIAGARHAVIGNDIALFRVHSGSITGARSLATEFQADRERLFAKATGRQRRRADWPLAGLARLVKYALNPAYMLRRLRPVHRDDGGYIDRGCHF